MMAVRFGWTSYNSDVGLLMRDTGDPLGLRAWATRVARRLVPMFTPQHQTLWGFALVCGGRTLSGELSTSVDGGMDEAWLRAEIVWVHAQTRALHQGMEVPSWPGIKEAQRNVQAASLLISGERPLLLHPLVQGSWGRYRRGGLGAVLLRRREGLTGLTPQSFNLSAHGQKIGAWFLSHLGAKARRAWKNPVRFQVVTTEQLALFPPATRVPPKKLAQLVEDALGEQRTALANLRRLRTAFDHDPEAFISPAQIHRGALSLRQQESVDSALAVQRLVDELELPYRAWLVGRSDEPPDAGLWSLPAWDQAAFDQERDLLDLRDTGSMEPSWKAVDAWQRALAVRRGAPILRRNEVPERFAMPQVPTFGLPSLAGLFAEGLLGQPHPVWWRNRTAEEVEG